LWGASGLDLRLFLNNGSPALAFSDRPTNERTNQPTTNHHNQPNARTAEEGVSWEFAQEGGGNPLTEHHVTPTDRSTNPWFGVFYDSLAKRGVPLTPEVGKEGRRRAGE